MTQLNVIRACGHTAPTHNETDPERCRLYVEATRNSHCQECPDVLAAGIYVKTTTEEVRVSGYGKNAVYERREKREEIRHAGAIKIAPYARIGVYEAEPKHAVEIWHRHDGAHCSVVQLTDHRAQHAVLSRLGFAVLIGSLRTHWKPTMRGATPELGTYQLDRADVWIADHARPDHSHHVCPACREVTFPCDDLGCASETNSYKCNVCYRAADDARREAATANAHTQHACGECGDLTPVSYPCSAGIDSHIATYCHACGETAGRWPASTLADRPLVHCPIEGCRVIVAAAGVKCAYHGTKRVTPQVPASKPRYRWTAEQQMVRVS